MSDKDKIIEVSEEKEEVEEKSGDLKKKTKQMQKKELIEKKRAQIKLKKEQKKYKKLVAMPEPTQQILRAAGGGLIGILVIVALTYIMWGILTDESILYAGAMIDTLSMGNAFNSLLGVWALAFTPLTSIGHIITNWGEIWYYTIIPILIAGLIIGLTTKRFSTAILGGIFFMFWGIVLPIMFVYIFSVFSIFDPTLLDSLLVGMLNGPLDQWNYEWLLPIFNNNIFLTWTAAGALEYGLIVTGIAIIISLPIQLIKG